MLRSRVFDSLLVDMEAASGAALAQRWRIPFLAAKVVADTARHGEEPASFLQQAKSAVNVLGEAISCLLTQRQHVVNRECIKS